MCSIIIIRREGTQKETLIALKLPTEVTLAFIYDTLDTSHRQKTDSHKYRLLCQTKPRIIIIILFCLRFIYLNFVSFNSIFHIYTTRFKIKCRFR